MLEKVIENDLSPEAMYDILDAYLTDILLKSDAKVGNEVMGLLVSYNRHLRIALGLPVEVAS